MKKLSTIQKEMQKLRKYIKENIEYQDENRSIKQNVSDSLAAYIALTWVSKECKWTPSKIYRGKLNE